MNPSCWQRPILRTALLILLGFGCQSAPANDAPLFESDHALAFTLSGPVKKLIRNVRGEPKYWPFALQIDGHTIRAEVRTRGNSRRAACDFPPLRLKLKRKDAAGTVFAGQRKLKLVTHCYQKPSFVSNTLEEFAAYRILNLLTPASFKVRLARITYRQGRKARSGNEQWGFLIEDVDAMALRLDGKSIEPEVIAPKRLQDAHAVRVALFQFLIGNTDYSVVAAAPNETCCHNAKLIQTGAGIFGIPYDFDMTGLVDPSHDDPRLVVNQHNVRVREYRGFCTDDNILADGIAAIASRAADIQALINGLPELAERDRRKSQRFLDAGLTAIAEGGATYFNRHCREVAAGR